MGWLYTGRTEKTFDGVKVFTPEKIGKFIHKGNA